MTRMKTICKVSSAKRLRLATILLALFVTVASPVASATEYFVFNTLALHLKNADERRAFTPGVGWEYSPSGKFGFHVGTASDSFGYQATYAGFNWATQTKNWGKARVRFLLGATVLHKQFHKNSEPETKVVPFPVMEIGLTKKAVLNISGSPQIDFAGLRNNTVIFLQFKWNAN